MIRILFLSFYYRPDLCAGSFRNSPLLDELSRQSREKDIQIDLFTTMPNRYATFKKEAKQVEEFGNVRVERIPVPGHKSGIIDQALTFRTYFFETLRKTKNTEYDLVYGSSSRFFTSYLAYRIAKKKNCPLYIDVRDIFSETLAEVSSNPVVKNLFPPFIKQLENRVYKSAAHINLISKGFMERFSDFNADKLSTFTHGVDPVFLKKPKQNPEIRQRARKRILYAGNVGEGQCLHNIVPDAARLLERTHDIVIIGDGGAIDKLRSALTEKDVSNVQLRKPVEREELLKEYHSADILFLHLNNIDIFKKVLPSKIFELAVIGKPILAGVSGYAANFLQTYVPHSYIFKPSDTAQMVDIASNRLESGLKEFDNEKMKNFADVFSRDTINRRMAATILNTIH